jgi:preprotein translocase subunit SecG
VTRLTILTVLLVLALPAVAFGTASGEGLYGETNDKVVTNFGFFLIAFFPLFIFAMSMLQWRLDKRKERRKAASKARTSAPEWGGGW